jgi:activator of HSP90 ATPase
LGLACAIERVKESQSTDNVEDTNEENVEETSYDCEDIEIFTDLFNGDSDYDCYFAHIFGCKK